MNRWVLRLMVGLACSMVAVFFLSSPVQAGEIFQEPVTDNNILDCRKCHSSIYEVWEESAHGQGLSCEQCHLSAEQDHVREGHGVQGSLKNCMECHTTGYDSDSDTYEEQNIHCTACHSPVPENHWDENPVPINRSEELCGQCHIQAHFEWQISKHGQVGVACVSCHSQHATSLKAKDVSEQCAKCHGAKVKGFSHSRHGEEGLSCADCHLAPLEGPVGGGGAKRDHSFAVDISVCTTCHTYELHNGEEEEEVVVDVPLSPPGELDSMASTTTEGVCEEPASGSPFGLTAAIGLSGLIVGVVVTPIIRQRFFNNDGKGE